jgi:hypothetical protein
MRRVHTTFDLLEGHILAGLLRDNGIEAWLFDADFVRQDWFKSLAYGGYRVVVRDADLLEARTLVASYFDGSLALPAEDAAACPRCAHTSAYDDPQPRRNVFIAMIVLPIVEFVALLRLKLAPVGMLAVFAAQFFLYATLPWLILRYFKWRQRCRNCGHRWRLAPAQSHAELARLAQAGDAVQ